MSEQKPNVEDIIERYSVVASPIKSKLYIGLGCVFTAFAIIGIWIPGWPTISWAIPAAFLFSLSSQRLFRWSLTNPYFGGALLAYYAAGKTIPFHAKILVILCITMMTMASAFFVFRISYPADPGYGPGTIILAGALGVLYILIGVKTRKTQK